MGVKIQTIKDIRFYLANELTELYSKEEIRALSDILIKTVTGITKLHELYDNGFEISASAAEKIFDLVVELKSGKPLQYVLGETRFYNCTIKVNSSTLIPRPETEELVDIIIRENNGYTGNILDFGTGSGCIAIALAFNLPFSSVTGVDISEEAIITAKENAVLNRVNISFIKEDIFNFDPSSVDRVGIIVSNPPYVRNSEKSLMNRNVLDFEPHLALFVPDSDPLVYYKTIIKLADEILFPHGLIYFEINEASGKSLFSLLETAKYSDIKIISDINGKERIIKGRKNE